jgi:hypothetical protein
MLTFSAATLLVASAALSGTAYADADAPHPGMPTAAQMPPVAKDLPKPTSPEAKAEAGKKPSNSIPNVIERMETILKNFLKSYEPTFERVLAAREAWKNFVNESWKPADNAKRQELRPKYDELLTELRKASILWESWYVGWLNYHIGVAKSWYPNVVKWEASRAAYLAHINTMRTALAATAKK